MSTPGWPASGHGERGERRVKQQPGPGDDEVRWEEVARLRNEHPDWVIIWLAAAGQFRAYRLSEARRADGLIATTAAGLAERMSRAPQRRR
jgi:hypothetical protein